MVLHRLPALRSRLKTKRQPRDEVNNARKNRKGPAPLTQPQPSMVRGAVGGNSYCVLHETTSHSTEDCYTIAKLKSDMAQRGRGTGANQAVEAARAWKNDPG